MKKTTRWLVRSVIGLLIMALLVMGLLVHSNLKLLDLIWIRMATFTQENFDVNVDNKLDNSISVYKLDSSRYIVLLDNYVTGRCGKGVYYLNFDWKEIDLLTYVIKLELKNGNKILKINKSSMEDISSFLQRVDCLKGMHCPKGTLKITNDEIRFTPDTGMLNPCHISKKTEGKEIILKRKQVK